MWPIPEERKCVKLNLLMWNVWENIEILINNNSNGIVAYVAKYQSNINENINNVSMT